MGPCYKSEGYGGQVEMLKFLTVGAIALAFAGPETLTLACKGETTTYQQGARPEPIALGLVIDFTKRTIKGFPLAGEIEITQITASAIYFHKFAASSVFDGRIDRITGDVEGHAASYKSTKGADMLKPDNVASGFNFALKCTPTQRMF